MIIAILMFDRKLVKANMMSRVFIICVFIIWTIIFLITKRFIQSNLSFCFSGLFSDHKLFLIYLVIIKIISMTVFALDKIAALEKRWRISIITLQGLVLVGVSIGALVGMYLFHHKTKKDYFKVGVPLIIVMQVMVLFCLMNANCF